MKDETISFLKFLIKTHIDTMKNKDSLRVLLPDMVVLVCNSIGRGKSAMNLRKKPVLHSKYQVSQDNTVRLSE